MATRWQLDNPKWRILLFGILFIGLTVAGIYVVYSAFADQSFTFDRRLLSPSAIAATVILLLIYFASDGLRLYYTLRALGHDISLSVIARLVFINLFFSNITPMATGGGFAQIWYLHKNGVSAGHATAATTIRTVLAVLFIFTLTPIGLFTLEPLNSSSIFRDIGSTLILLVIVYLSFFVTVIFRTRWLIYPSLSFLRLLFRFKTIKEETYRSWHYKIRREILRFSFAFREYFSGGTLWVVLSVVFTVIFLLSLFSFPAVLIYALGYDVNYLTIIGLLVVTTFVMYFSPTPGASGISEGVFGSFFKDILGSNHLILVIVAWRFLTIYLGMIIGIFIFQKTLSEAANVSNDDA
ncbi:lysylphosphatidylglycerol synthase transmembrane domain-containing protein [Rhodohalobacter sp.]|uniref:lysylphosphatidylglycerol synthase transmembrane domain-containing protein n=1 Tax=Rhodohalobacter sp. TaxID=1974210 RepID=UPI002ACEF11D|nr:lysylphosphatidylglycerol synthase transmembrane domain-containing protein [Rhodohalobacter sp.]MDZ7755837.1 lysylphosphatidylglycerol synthase transmembrane domain-containing protein [Rhodohalobacter sp.]